MRVSGSACVGCPWMEDTLHEDIRVGHTPHHVNAMICSTVGNPTEEILRANNRGELRLVSILLYILSRCRSPEFWIQACFPALLSEISSNDSQLFVEFECTHLRKEGIAEALAVALEAAVEVVDLYRLQPPRFRVPEDMLPDLVRARYAAGVARPVLRPGHVDVRRVKPCPAPSERCCDLNLASFNLKLHAMQWTNASLRLTVRRCFKNRTK